jgi:tRNA (adenine37-N6)-methyltransferase
VKKHSTANDSQEIHMSDDTIIYQPIGIIRTPYSNINDMPIQPSGAQNVRGELVIKPEFIEGLSDLDGFSHIFLIYHFHQVKSYELIVVPFMDDVSRGVFATRAPKRPNPIGISIVRLLSVEGNILTVENVDLLNGTPILDIKPYVPVFDHYEVERVGWLTGCGSEIETKRSDERFA